MNIETIRNMTVSQQNQHLIESFNQHFSSYLREKEQRITSRVDKSVYLIGSAISVLKPYFLEDRIPPNGVFLIQRAIRTQGLRTLYEAKVGEWSPYFKAMGVLVNYSDLNKLCDDVWKYYNKQLGIQPEDMIIRGSEKDKDLLQYWQENEGVPRVELDTKPAEYYTHRYGLQDVGIAGRNINLAIRDPNTSEYRDIGNIISIEGNGRKYGAEAAFGVSNTISKINGFQNSIEGDLVTEILNFDTIQQYKFGDCLTVTTHLAHEGLKPNASNTQR